MLSTINQQNYPQVKIDDSPTDVVMITMTEIHPRTNARKSQVVMLERDRIQLMIDTLSATLRK